MLKKRDPSPAVVAKYRKISNMVCHRYPTRCGTKKHVLNICENYSRGSKKFWSWINQSKGHRNPIPPLVCDDVTMSDDVGRASCFNKYFSSVFTTEDFHSLPDVKSTIVSGPDLINTVQFTPEVVFNALYL